MSLEPEELTPEMKLYTMIEKVVIISGAISSDPKAWELYIQGKVLKLDTDRLENMKQFGRQYLKAFDRPAPRIKLSRWPSLLEALAEDKAIYAQAPEESRPVFIARQMFEIVCDREASDDAEEALSGFALFKHFFKDDEKGFWCKKSGCVAKSVKNITIRKVNHFHEGKIIHKGKNYRLKLQKYYFCNRTCFIDVLV